MQISFAYMNIFLYLCAKIAQKEKDKLLYNAARVCHRTTEGTEEGRGIKRKVKSKKDQAESEYEN